MWGWGVGGGERQILQIKQDRPIFALWHPESVN